jgi:hypothetical protein
MWGCWVVLVDGISMLGQHSIPVSIRSQLHATLNFAAICGLFEEMDIHDNS